ncbi:MAG: hypothetical protein KatS3mg105_1249 [Gemmatales bacterium]|nr:MAG: hypothetical protein KatS3mg105_1249 [Gemmatales bacterium]
MANEIQAVHTSAKTLYALVRDVTANVWNGSTFEPYNSASLASYAIAMTEQGSASGYYTADFPAVVAGEYNVAVYERLGASPAEGDLPVAEGEVHWDGNTVVPRLTPAQIHAEVADVLRTEALAELGEVPPPAPSLEQAVMFLYMALRNTMTVTAAQQKIRNAAGSVIATAALSDDSTTFTRNQFS